MSYVSRVTQALRRALTVVGVVSLSLLHLTVAHAATPAQRRCARTYEQAQEHAIRGELLQARRLLKRCLEMRCGRFLRRECRVALQDVNREIPSVILSFRAKDGRAERDIRVEMDGETLVRSLDGEPVFVNPGFHTFTFFTANGRRYNRLLTVRRGEKELPVVLEEQSPEPAEVAASTDDDGRRDDDRRGRRGDEEDADARDSRGVRGVRGAALQPTEGMTMDDEPVAVRRQSSTNLLPYIVGGSSLALGLGGFITFRLIANSKYEELPLCYPNCPLEQVDEVSQWYQAADISLAVGAAGVGVGVLLWFLDSDDDQQEQFAKARPFIAPHGDGALTGISGSF